MKAVFYFFVAAMIFITGVIEGNAAKLALHAASSNKAVHTAAVGKNATNNIQQFFDISMLEPLFTEQANHLTLLMSLFTGMLTIFIAIFSVIIYFKGKSITESIDNNKTAIEDIKKELEKDIKNYKEKIETITKEQKLKIENELKEYKEKLDSDIKELTTTINTNKDIAEKNIDKFINEVKSTNKELKINSDKYREKIDKQLKENLLDIKSYTKDTLNQHKELINDIKDSVSEEVSKQMIHNTKELISNTKEYAYKEISEKIDTIVKDAQKSLFSYQNIVYTINQTKKLDYEKALDSKKLDLEKKIDKMIFIQNKYNEINNQTIPKLFSKDINLVIEAAEKLAEYKKLHRIIIRFLKKLLKKDTFTWAQKYQIKEVLKKRYNTDVDKDISKKKLKDR